MNQPICRISRNRSAATVILGIVCAVAVAVPVFAAEGDEETVVYGFGRPATAEEIASWDIDVRPDGKGLPAGSGTPAEGALIYAAQCAACHGAQGEGGLNDRLVVHSADEPFPSASDVNAGQHRTIGNYWPYATTVFDYIRRSMPFTAPGTLDENEVYSLTAHLLHLNHVIPEDAVMNAETLPQVVMPAHGKFRMDDRQDYKEVH